MFFISIEFYLFLIAVLVLYYVLPLKYRWFILLGGSLGFYYQLSKENWWIFALAAVISYVAGIILEKEKGRKFVLAAAILIVLVPLVMTKIGSEFWDAVYRHTGFAWVAPLGLAFYTMQMISYLVDIYRGKITAQRNILKYFLFVSFFPQILQGPIPRYEQLANQLYEGHRFEEKNFTKGLHLIIWGFFLKMMIADKAGIVVDEIFAHPGSYVGWYVLVAGVLYSVQLYADFQAYVCIAKGVAGLFGIQLADNFNHPYKSGSVKEFWHRWHISLSTWLKDYVYIPLGGNRKGIVRKYLNLVITFAVSGIWHGSGIKFLCWGLMHAFYQIVGTVLAPVKEKAYKSLGMDEDSGVKKAIQTVGTCFWVMLAWIIFRAETLKDGVTMIVSMFRVNNAWILFNNALFKLGLSWKECLILVLAIALFGWIGRLQEKYCIRDVILKQPIVIRWGLYIGGILIIFVFGTYGYGFNAQDFIYGGF